LQTQIWRRPPTDPKQRRSYYALQRKAAQVERSNPKQAHALKMQARALEDVSELLIAVTSCTDELIDDHRQADDDRHQVEAAPVAGRASSEPLPGRELLRGIRPCAHLVNVPITQPSGTSSAAGAAPSVTGGGSHAQTSVRVGEVNELWISAKRAQIATLERQGHHERAAFLRGVLGLG
jgi:hypothetical protein